MLRISRYLRTVQLAISKYKYKYRDKYKAIGYYNDAL